MLYTCLCACIYAQIFQLWCPQANPAICRRFCMCSRWNHWEQWDNILWPTSDSRFHWSSWIFVSTKSYTLFRLLWEFLAQQIRESAGDRPRWIGTSGKVQTMGPHKTFQICGWHVSCLTTWRDHSFHQWSWDHSCEGLRQLWGRRFEDQRRSYPSECGIGSVPSNRFEANVSNKNVITRRSVRRP